MSVRPLIPRRKLFDNPTFFGAKLSPDGRFLSWLAPADGVMNVWVSLSDNIAEGRPVTRTKGRPINGRIGARTDATSCSSMTRMATRTCISSSSIP
jgi:hypothetical protein